MYKAVKDSLATPEEQDLVTLLNALCNWINASFNYNSFYSYVSAILWIEISALEILFCSFRVLALNWDEMKFTWLVCTLFFLQDEAPFKPTDEFEIKLNFVFKERQRGSPNTIELDLTQKEAERLRGSGPLPYLFLNLRVLKLGPDEARIRIYENGKRSVMNKKFDMNKVLKLDLGFTDDIKDRIGAYEYHIFFLSQDKDPVSKIIIYFEENGTYLVNGEVRGKL